MQPITHTDALIIITALAIPAAMLAHTLIKWRLSPPKRTA